MVSRRQILTAGMVGGAALLLPRSAWPATPSAILDPSGIGKYVTPLVIPPAMPVTSTLQKGTVDYYAIAVRQFRQQILPPGMPATTVWGYGSTANRRTFNYRRSPSRPRPTG